MMHGRTAAVAVSQEINLPGVSANYPITSAQMPFFCVHFTNLFFGSVRLDASLMPSSERNSQIVL